MSLHNSRLRSLRDELEAQAAEEERKRAEKPKKVESGKNKDKDAKK